MMLINILYIIGGWLLCGLVAIILARWKFKDLLLTRSEKLAYLLGGPVSLSIVILEINEL